MRSRRIAVLLASALGVATASAQTIAGSVPNQVGASGKPHATQAHAKKPVPPARGAAVAPRPRSPILGSGGEDEAASLERRRKAFFAPKPDGGGSEEPPQPSAGVTLGGSGGISPGMGFKF